jgi:nitroreductase
MLANARPMLKKLIPRPVVEGVRRAASPFQATLLLMADSGRFYRHHSRSTRADDPAKLLARIVFHSHAIEKGLSHRELRFGFGEYAISKLSEALDSYHRQGFAQDDKAYLSALATLRAYRDLHELAGFQQTPLQRAPAWLLGALDHSSTDLGGVLELQRPSHRPSDDRTFRDVVEDRHSVRDFSDASVPGEALRQAISMATRSPSVCNRQSIRVRVLDDPALIAKVQLAQGGLLGYPTPPVMLAVTSDVRRFVHVTERNQPFVDGGLFSMSLLLALESVNLAACALNAMFSASQDRRLRSILRIPAWEIFIMFIAVGEFSEGTKVPTSFRYSAAEITA